MNYVIIGNSAAGIGAVEGIRQVDRNGQITVISDEPHHTYSRPLISYLLLGKTDEEKMKYRPESFYEDNGCSLVFGKARSIDAKAKTVTVSDGKTGNEKVFPYDKLLVATGSTAFVPSFEGLETVPERFTFMSLDDANYLDAALGQSQMRILIIGAGLIGLKCAEGILKRASKITLLDLAPNILSSILDEDGSKIVQKHLEAAGLEFVLSRSVAKFDGNCAELDNGDKIKFDLLVLALGVRPNTSLLQGIAEIDKGIKINNKSETTAADIYAAGDCTQSSDISSGQSKIMALLPNAYIQGECAGVNMAGGDKTFDKAIPMNAIGFLGGKQPEMTRLHIITAGSYVGDVYSQGCAADFGGVASKGNAAADFNGTYKRLFYSDNKLNGFILIGDIDKAGIYTSLIREQTPLDTIDFALICEKPGLMAFTKSDRQAKLGGTA